MDELVKLIEEERQRFTDEDNNIFAFSFYKITRYINFLNFLIGHYGDLSKRWKSTRDSLMEISKGKEDRSKEVFAIFNISFSIEEEIQLEIESFYIFSKTLLDKTAIALWQYFGPTNKKSIKLSSHDNLTTHLSEYAKIKKLQIPEALLERAIKLRSDVSDFRDWQISHERNPERKLRWSRMTILDEGSLKLRVGRFYSDGKKEMILSKKLEDLHHQISEYLAVIVKFIEQNKSLTTYKSK